MERSAGSEGRGGHTQSGSVDLSPVRASALPARCLPSPSRQEALTSPGGSTRGQQLVWTRRPTQASHFSVGNT